MEKSIQRDIDDIKSYLSGADGGATDIRYDGQAKGYRLVEEESRCLTRKEILAMAKILLESRAFAKEELYTILDKLYSGPVVKTSFSKTKRADWLPIREKLITLQRIRCNVCLDLMCWAWKCYLMPPAVCQDGFP